MDGNPNIVDFKKRIKYQSVDKWVSKYRYIHIEEQYAAITNNGLYLLTKNISIKRERDDCKACLKLE